MATCRRIVNTALRKLGRLGAGREPRSADTAECLAALQGLYTTWIENGAFGRLGDVTPLSDYAAGENQRVIRNAGVEITLPDRYAALSYPQTYSEERTYYPTQGTDGNWRSPRNGAVIQIVDAAGSGLTRSYLYDRTRVQWVQIEALQLDHEAPLSAADPEGLAAALAIEVSDTFGAEIGPATISQANRFRYALASNPSMPRREVQGVYC